MQHGYATVAPGIAGLDGGHVTMSSEASSDWNATATTGNSTETVSPSSIPVTWKTLSSSPAVPCFWFTSVLRLLLAVCAVAPRPKTMFTGMYPVVVGSVEIAAKAKPS